MNARTHVLSIPLCLLLALACGEAPKPTPTTAAGSAEAGASADEHGFGAPSAATVAANAAFGAGLAPDDLDFEEARRGLIESDPEMEVKTPDGRSFRQRAFDFVRGEAPASVNPSLWRQAQLNDIHGLFQVSDGI